MPYHLVGAAGYLDVDRCNELAGCSVSGASVDTIGVQITYDYQWHTPLHGLLPLPGGGYQLVKSNAMRMEPVL